MARSAVSLAEDYPLPKRKVRWVGIVFFLIIHVVGLIGTPLYLYYRGITSPEFALFFVFLVATGMSTTLGYHRLFAPHLQDVSPSAVSLVGLRRSDF